MLTQENSPEVELRDHGSLEDLIPQNPVYLISSEMPGSGCTSLAKALAERLNTHYNTETHTVFVGQEVRRMLGVTDEMSLQAKLKEVGDPRKFDPEIYANLPNDRPCIIDGKLATTVGPQYISEGRPIVNIDLTSSSIVSAKRVMQREGFQFNDIFGTDEDSKPLLGRLSMVAARSEHDNDMRKIMQPSNDATSPASRSNMHYLSADTGSISTFELVEQLTSGTDFTQAVPSQEITMLRQTLAHLAHTQIMLGERLQPSDAAHFSHQYQSIRYNADRLNVTLAPVGIASIREDLKKAITDSWFGLMMKQAPRFFENGNGEVTLDERSQRWTPQFYKLAEAWPTLSNMLKDKDILDPFGGAGTSVNLLAARGIPRSAAIADLSYASGKPLDEEGHTYRPDLNSQMSQLLFDDLPSWYKPSLNAVKGYVTADALHLPFQDNSVDYIVTDPPYGKNCPSGGLQLLLDALPDFERVAKEGSILMVPLEWTQELKNAHYEVQQLTGDVSRGQSKLPVCYILINSSKMREEIIEQ